MPINHDAVGSISGPEHRAWTERDAMLYALGVGAGPRELSFVTENSTGLPLQVLPSMAVVLGTLTEGIWKAIGDFDLAHLVHGEQAVELHGTIPVEGAILATSEVVGVYDKGTAAVVVVETDCRDADSGRPMFTTRCGMFIRGEGGWGGGRGPSSKKEPLPDRPPDHTVVDRTHASQSLLYRLSGDRNPLHSDPLFARQAGFEGPILHGLCTWGFTARALLHTLCGSDPARFRTMSSRFSAPALPEDELTVRIWAVGDGEAVFQAARSGGDVVIDAGRFHHS